MEKIQDTLIIIPAFNEGLIVGRVIDDIKNIVPEIDILVINDGSTDDTANTVRRHGASVISLPFNLGYGSALETGYKYAHEKGYNYVLQMDADGQHDPRSINIILDPIKKGEADLVIGSRFWSGSLYQPTFIRSIGMVIFAKLTSFLIGQKISDSTSGFQAMNKKVFNIFINEIYPSDYPDADIIIMLHRMGFKIKEVPVIMNPSQSQKSMHSGIFKPLYYIFKMLLSISMIFLRKPYQINK